MTDPKTPPSICFVTNELYPLRKGGIGRMLFNFARQNAATGTPAEIHFLVPPDLVAGPGEESRLRDALGDMAALHIATPLYMLPDAEAHLFDQASFKPWTLELLQSTSYRYYRSLRAIEADRGAPFDFIEFPDFGGWGLASVEAKRAGLAFADTTITARLHSTQGMISRAERFYESSHWNGMLMDAERHLLAHADLIVGHVQSIIDQNAAHYRLADRWDGRTVLEFPPILLEETETGAVGAEAETGPCEDFIFSSRLQPFKRPDIFVRAAIAFLEKHPDHPGSFRLVSYGWDRRYIDWLKGLVPVRFRSRVIFIDDATAAERSAWLARSVVVVPSDYESLCLFAFESAQMGRPVVLNGRCSAFGESPRWSDGENCLLFDGTVGDLVRAMEQARTWRPTQVASVEVDPPYWLADHDLPATSLPGEDPIRISLMITGIAERKDLRAQMIRAAFLEGELDLAGGDELIVLLPRGMLAPDADEIRAIEDRGWRVMWSSGSEECPEEFGLRLAGLAGGAVLVCPTGHDLHPGFVSAGREAMQRNPRLMIFGGHLAIDEPDTGRTSGLRVFGGEFPSLAMVSSRIAPVVSLLRRSLLTRRRLDSRAGRFWLEVFLRDCAIDREPILIAPIIAASISRSVADAAETTARISAGVMDRAGIEAGLPGRLLGLDPRLNDDEFFRSPRVLKGKALASGRRLLPDGLPRDWEPVQYLPDWQCLMVHPLKEGVTIAELDVPQGPVSRITADLRNLNLENDGCEAAIACVPQGLDENWVLSVLSGRINAAPRFPISDWVPVSAGQTGEVGLSAPDVGDEYRLLLLTRLIENGREFKAHLAFERLTLW